MFSVWIKNLKGYIFQDKMSWRRFVLKKRAGLCKYWNKTITLMRRQKGISHWSNKFISIDRNRSLSKNRLLDRRKRPNLAKSLNIAWRGSSLRTIRRQPRNLRSHLNKRRRPNFAFNTVIGVNWRLRRRQTRNEYGKNYGTNYVPRIRY